MNKLCYPYASELNPLLYKISKEDIELSNSASLNDINKPEIRTVKVPGDATLTALNIHQKGIKEVDRFFNWLNKSIGIEIKRSWVIMYNKGQGADKHNHKEYNTTFSYGVNIPEGSSSLNVSGKEIKLSVSEVISFPGKLFHHVLPSDVDGRCILVGHGQ